MGRFPLLSRVPQQGSGLDMKLDAGTARRGLPHCAIVMAPAVTFRSLLHVTCFHWKYFPVRNILQFGLVMGSLIHKISVLYKMLQHY